VAAIIHSRFAPVSARHFDLDRELPPQPPRLPDRGVAHTIVFLQLMRGNGVDLQCVRFVEISHGVLSRYIWRQRKRWSLLSRSTNAIARQVRGPTLDRGGACRADDRRPVRSGRAAPPGRCVPVRAAGGSRAQERLDNGRACRGGVAGRDGAGCCAPPGGMSMGCAMTCAATCWTGSGVRLGCSWGPPGYGRNCQVPDQASLLARAWIPSSDTPSSATDRRSTPVKSSSAWSSTCHRYLNHSSMGSAPQPGQPGTGRRACGRRC
jgi:hypothetical protein